MRRVGELDGVRGLAILLVIAGHAGGIGMDAGGFVGVTLFFVLSGYLITGILARQLDGAGRIDLRRFWARRARRLLPAFALVAIVPLAIYLLRGEPLTGLLTIALVPVMDYSNALGGPSVILHHTWSLAIEEQFYLIWPVALAALWGFRRRLALVVAIFVALAAWRVGVVATGHGVWAYYALDTNAYALMAGAAAALAPRRLAGWWAWSGLLVVVGAALFPWTELVEGALAPVVALGAVALVLGCPSLGWLAARPLRYAGRVSYGWYLWHYPVMLVVWEAAPAARWAAAAVSLAIAAMSWRLVEKPFLDRGPRSVELRPAPRDKVAAAEGVAGDEPT